MSTSDTLALVRAALAKAQTGVDLAKSFTQSASPTTGLTAYMLEAPAKTLYPVITPLRNKIPRVGGGTGIQANWRAVTKINANNVYGGVSEGNRGGVLTTTTKEYLAAFRALGMEDWVSFEADLAAQGFDDVKARAVQGLLQSLMIYEEMTILGGNGSNALGQTPTPTLVAATTGGSIAASTAVDVVAVALTMEGYYASTGGNVPGMITRTNADGSTDTYGGGAAMASANATVTTSAGTATNSVIASVTPVTGAFGYAWFVGSTSSNQKLLTVTTVPTAVIAAIPTSGQALPAQLVNTDCSVNNLVFDGLLTLATKAGSGSYIYQMPAGAAGTGTPLTADGTGGIVEIDQVLKSLWDNYRLSPSEMWVSSQEIISMRKKALAGGSTSTQRFTFSAAQDQLRAGGMVRGYLNPFSMAGANEIPILMHPNMPQGTILFLTHNLPYRLSGVDNVIRVLTRKEYYQLEWPLTTRRYQYGCYCDEVLQHYYTPSMAVITGIAPG